MGPWSILAMVIWLLLFMALPAAGQAGQNQSCPLRSRTYRAQPVKTHLNATVNDAVCISFTLDPPEPPVGFFLSVNMNLRQGPLYAAERAPEILTGFPDTSAVFKEPGIYLYEVIVSLIAKSSCGGVKADTIFKGDVRINVQP
jgi:hypothetical protein